MNTIQKMTAREATALQPLREVGTEEKTQFWDMEEVMQALRIANRRGIPVSELFNQPDRTAVLAQVS